MPEGLKRTGLALAAIGAAALTACSPAGQPPAHGEEAAITPAAPKDTPMAGKDGATTVYGRTAPDAAMKAGGQTPYGSAPPPPTDNMVGNRDPNAK